MKIISLRHGKKENIELDYISYINFRYLHYRSKEEFMKVSKIILFQTTSFDLEINSYEKA